MKTALDLRDRSKKNSLSLKIDRKMTFAISILKFYFQKKFFS